MPPAWSVQPFEWGTGSTSESHAAVVSDSLWSTVGGQRTVGIMRSLRGPYAGMLQGVDESLGSSGGQTRGAPGITAALDLPPAWSCQVPRLGSMRSMRASLSHNGSRPG